MELVEAKVKEKNKLKMIPRDKIEDIISKYDTIERETIFRKFKFQRICTKIERLFRYQKYYRGSARLFKLR